MIIPKSFQQIVKKKFISNEFIPFSESIEFFRIFFHFQDTKNAKFALVTKKNLKTSTILKMSRVSLHDNTEKFLTNCKKKCIYCFFRIHLNFPNFFPFSKYKKFEVCCCNNNKNLKKSTILKMSRISLHFIPNEFIVFSESIWIFKIFFPFSKYLFFFKLIRVWYEVLLQKYIRKS